MFDPDLPSIPMASREARSNQGRSTRDRHMHDLGLELQPWHTSSGEEHVRSRFGGFERQIEAEVLQSLNRFGG